MSIHVAFIIKILSTSKVKEAAEDILNYLDCVEQDAMAKEAKRSLQGGGAAKPLTRYCHIQTGFFIRFPDCKNPFSI